MVSHEALADAFLRGVWAQHLADQHSRSASVQGVRLFFAAAEPAEDEAARLRGLGGYVCALQGFVRRQGDALQLDFARVKSALVASKAWDANYRAFLQLQGCTVAVISLENGRPKERKFAPTDELLGLYVLEVLDADVLACELQPALTCAKRRRVYSCAGAMMGSAADMGFTGMHCKDIWIQALRRAELDVRVNAYCIADPDILEELRSAAARGVAVRVRYDHRQQSRTLPGVFDEERFREVAAHALIVSQDERLLMHKKELSAPGRCAGAPSWTQRARARWCWAASTPR
jgi:hypothetical protein